MKTDIQIIRELAARYMELATAPENQERLSRAFLTNDLQQPLPLVYLDEIPWHEIEGDERLLLHCRQPFMRQLERQFRRKLFLNTVIGAENVLLPDYYLKMNFSGDDIGLQTEENIRKTDEANYIVSHEYLDVLKNEDDLAMVTLPVLKPKKAQYMAEKAALKLILGGIMYVKRGGNCVYSVPWDKITRLMGATNLLIKLWDEPDFMHAVIKKFTDVALSRMEQMERLDLLSLHSDTLHCTPYQTHDLPSSDFDGKHYKLCDVWYRGAAQLFSSVSPSMFKEYELDYSLPLMKRCGLVYFGCCEALHDRINLLKEIPNLRKIGVSPWADMDKAAEQIGTDYVFARKPNPALVATKICAEAVEADISSAMQAIKRNNCSAEFVLKDISTCAGKVENLIEWTQLAKSTIRKHYD